MVLRQLVAPRAGGDRSRGVLAAVAEGPPLALRPSGAAPRGVAGARQRRRRVRGLLARAALVLDSPRMRRGTYSIVARDAETGELGVAVHSHWFSVGQLAPWAEPGVGAAAVQSIPDPAAGARALELIRSGASAAGALDQLLEGDTAVAFRQIAVVDAAGRVAVHTGGGCIPHAGDETGEGFSCQANMMTAPTVPAAMAHAFAYGADAPAERLVGALMAAETEGGDIRGRQSAALVVVPAEGEPWRRRVDL